MKSIQILYLPLFILLFSAKTKAQDSVLIAALKDQVYSLSMDGDELGSEGAELIKKILPEYQFLLVGEQHGITEVGQFTKGLFRAANKHDFNYLCIETDPFIAKRLESLVSGDILALQDFCKELPFTIPFYDNEEDYDFLHKVVELKKNPGPMLWGVDQVFAAAPRYLFREMAASAPSEEAKELALAYYKKGVEGVNEFMSSGNQGATLMAQLGPEDYKILYKNFGDDPASTSSKILEGIQKTQEIYGYYFQGKQYDNNLVRAQLMKKQFLDYYHQALEVEKIPKVVFKFGATHSYRGLSYYDQFDLGNLASELAEMNGRKSLHINFMGLKGQASSGLMGTQEFDNTKDFHPLLYEAIKDRVTQDEWILVDFRPLRHQFNRRDLKPLKDLVFGYDMFIIVPNATPGTFR